MKDIKKLKDEITLEKIKKIIVEEKDWISSHSIAEYIVGTDIWKCLPEWDRKILKAHVHKIRREHGLVDYKNKDARIICRKYGIFLI